MRKLTLLAASLNDWDLLTLFLSWSVSPSQPDRLDHSSYLNSPAVREQQPQARTHPLPGSLCWRTEIHPSEDGSGSVLHLRVPHPLTSSQDHPGVFQSMRKLTVIPPDSVSCLALSVQFSSALYNN